MKDKMLKAKLLSKYQETPTAMSAPVGEIPQAMYATGGIPQATAATPGEIPPAMSATTGGLPQATTATPGELLKTIRAKDSSYVPSIKTAIDVPPVKVYSPVYDYLKKGKK